MAAGQTSQSRQAGARPWLRRAAVAALLAALAALVWYRAPINARAQADASFSARIVCSCRFVAGRSLSSCRGDLRPGTRFVMLSEDGQNKSVTATVPLLASQTAAYRRGQGCVLEPWAD